MERSEAERDYMTEGIFYLLFRQDQKQDKKLEDQVFLVCFLVPLCFASLSCLCLILKASVLGLTIGFAIGEIKSIGKEVTIGLFK